MLVGIRKKMRKIANFEISLSGLNKVKSYDQLALFLSQLIEDFLKNKF